MIDGAFHRDHLASAAMSFTGSWAQQQVNFDASRVSDVYLANSNVTPMSVCVIFLVKY